MMNYLSDFAKKIHQPEHSLEYTLKMLLKSQTSVNRPMVLMKWSFKSLRTNYLLYVMIIRQFKV
jgi:hypothetical protein